MVSEGLPINERHTNGKSSQVIIISNPAVIKSSEHKKTVHWGQLSDTSSSDIPKVMNAWNEKMKKSETTVQEQQQLMSKSSFSSHSESDAEQSEFLSDSEIERKQSKRKLLSAKNRSVVEPFTSNDIELNAMCHNAIGDEESEEYENRAFVNHKKGSDVELDSLSSLSVSSLEEGSPSFTNSKLIVESSNDVDDATECVISNNYADANEVREQSTALVTLGPTSSELYEGHEGKEDVETSFVQPPNSPSIQSTNSELVETEMKNLLDTSNTENLEEEQSTSCAMDEYVDDEDDDADSVASEFRGSLGISMPEDKWLSSVDVNLDIRLGRNEWSTTFSTVDGDASLENWGTTISEIADSDAKPEDWQVSLQEISHHNYEEDRDNWSTKVPESLELNETPEDWSTKFNTIENVNQSKSTWSTVFNKIKEHVPGRREWKTKFNSIAKTEGKKDKWKFKLPNKMSCNANDSDWNTTINKSGNVTGGQDQWEYQDRGVSVKTQDRETHWNSKFNDIGERNDLDLKNWTAALHAIAPMDGESSSWAFRMAEMSDDLGGPEDWLIKFIDIQKNLNPDQDWLLEMNDIPNSYRELSDWITKFLSIKEVLPEENPWSTKFNLIIPNGDESEFWTNSFSEPDFTDMARLTWQTQFNEILPVENPELDWEVQLNAIESNIEEAEE